MLVVPAAAGAPARYNKRTVIGGVRVTTVAAGVRAATGDARGRETLTGGVGRGEAG